MTFPVASTTELSLPCIVCNESVDLAMDELDWVTYKDVDHPIHMSHLTPVEDPDEAWDIEVLDTQFRAFPPPAIL